METMSRGWLALILLVPVAARAGTDSDAFGDRTVLRALSARTRGQDTEALEHFRTSLGVPRTGSRWAAVRLAAARAALAAGEAREAIGYLEGLEAELPEVADIVLGARARALRRVGDWDGALSSWRALLARVPDSPLADDARYGIADALLARREWDRAHGAYRTALAAAPRAFQASIARFNLAFLDERARRWEEAASGYSNIVHRRATDPMAELAGERLHELVLDGRAPEPSFDARLARIDGLLAGKKIRDAELLLNELEFAATTRSRQAAIKLRRAEIAYHQRDHDTAAELYGELARASRGWRKRSYEMWVARCYSASHQNDRAIRSYYAFSLRYPDEREAREALFKAAWLAYNARDHARAVTVFGEFIERYPDDAAVDEALWYLAWNCYRLGDLPTALATLGRLRRERPRSTLVQRAYYWQGRIYAQLGRGRRARASYRAAIDALPLDYYAMLARQRLRELDPAPGRLAYHASATLVAARGSASPETLSDAKVPRPFAPSASAEEGHRQPTADELPEGGGLAPLSPFRLPWGGAVLDWDNPAGHRALRLISLGMHAYAAEIVKTLPEVPGHDSATVTRARAWLLYTLGEFSSAHRIVLRRFRSTLRSAPSPDTRSIHQLAYPAAYHDLVRAAEDEFHVSPLLLLAIMRQESAFKVRARSWASAQGLMQIIPSTGERIAAELAVEPFTAAMLNIPEVNVRFGGWYIAQLLAKYDGHVVLALANYNAGPRATIRWTQAAEGELTDVFVEEIPYRETRHYVKRVLSNLWAYAVLYDGGELTLPERVPTTWAEEPSF